MNGLRYDTIQYVTMGWDGIGWDRVGGITWDDRETVQSTGRIERLGIGGGAISD